MHDARDAEDNRLLEAGEHARVVEAYYGLILGRCRARVWDEADAIGVAAEVVIRLLNSRLLLTHARAWSADRRCRPEAARDSPAAAP